MDTDNTRIALLMQQQQQDEIRIAALEKRLDAVDHKVFAGQIVILTTIGFGTFLGWLLNASEKVRAWFH